MLIYPHCTLIFNIYYHANKNTRIVLLLWLLYSQMNKVVIYHYIHFFETFSCLKLIHGPQQHGQMFGLSYLNHLDMTS